MQLITDILYHIHFVFYCIVDARMTISNKQLALPFGKAFQQEVDFVPNNRHTYGFQIGYSIQKSLKSAKRIFGCALDHPEIMDQYMIEELAQNRVASPFHIIWAPYMHIS